MAPALTDVGRYVIVRIPAYMTPDEVARIEADRAALGCEITGYENSINLSGLAARCAESVQIQPAMSEQQVGEALEALLEHGLVEQLQDGTWAMTELGLEAVQQPETKPGPVDPVGVVLEPAMIVVNSMVAADA